jgi:hypothetical protein
MALLLRGRGGSIPALVFLDFMREGMKSSQRLAKLRNRTGVRQHGTHVSQCLGDAHAAQPRAVERGDGGL